MSELKTYGLLQRHPDEGTYRRRIIACRYKKEAAEAFGVSMYTFNGYAAITGNESEVALAAKTPFKAVWGERG